MKLTIKFGLLAGIGAVVVVASAVFLIFTFTRSALEKSISEHQLAASGELINKIDRQLNNYVLSMQMIGEEEDLERFLDGESALRPEIDRRIRELTFLTGPWDILFVVDAKGVIVISTDPSEIGKSIAKEPLGIIAYEKAMKGVAYYSDMVISDDTGKPTIVFAAPIRDERGQRSINGVIIGNAVWATVSEMLRSSDISGLIDLYNKEGVLIATNQPETKNLFVAYPDVRQEIDHFREAPFPLIDIEQYVGDKELHLVSHAPSLGFLSYKGNGWLLMVKEPVRIAFDSARDVAMRAAFFMALTILFIIGIISFLFGRMLVRPIISLTKTAVDITEGGLNKRVVVASDDEIGTLGRTFNMMADVLVEDNKKISETSTRLQVELNKIEVLMESIGDGIVAIDREWNIILWNKTASTISGWTREEAMGQSFRKVIRFIRERDRKEYIMFIEEAMLHGKPYQLEDEALLIRKDGSEIPVGDSAAPIVDQSGMVTGAIIVFRDASREREARRFKSDFSYASHQIRTPVAKALWILESAMNKQTISEIKDGLQEAYHSIQSVNKLSEELIEVSRIDQKQVNFERTTVGLAEVFSDITTQLGERAKERHIVVNVSPISETAKVTTDIVLLKNALHEIIDNAIKYSKEHNAVNVDVAVNEDVLLISVSNLGGGILEEDQPLIFTKFFRGKNIDTTSLAGAGLGLYIAKEYIKLLGGKIWFDAVNEKVTFYISVPIV